jgi:hypothetical protein
MISLSLAAIHCFAVSLIAAIRKRLGFEIPIADIFDYPTIALLRERLEGHSESNVLPEIVILNQDLNTYHYHSHRRDFGLSMNWKEAFNITYRLS